MHTEAVIAVHLKKCLQKGDVGFRFEKPKTTAGSLLLLLMMMMVMASLRGEH